MINGTLGVLDPTMLVNDLYTVRLRVFDRGGNITTTQATSQVSRDVKVGNFTLSFQDLNVPMAGMPISVKRIYDSRDKRPGDFGIGWRLDVQTLRVSTNRVLGTGMDTARGPAASFPTYCISHDRPAQGQRHARRRHGRRIRHGARRRSCQQIIPLDSPVTASVTARPGTLGTLRLVDGGDLTSIVSGGSRVRSSSSTSTRSTLRPADVPVHEPRRDGVRDRQDRRRQSMRDRTATRYRSTPTASSHSAGEQRDVHARRARAGSRGSPIRRQRINYTYDANGDLASHVDPLGNMTRFTTT